MTDRPDFRQREALGAADQDRVRQAVSDLAEADPALRRLAAQFLGRLAEPDALPRLARAAADPDRTVRQAALEALAAFGPAAREALRDALSDPQPAVRLAALRGVFRVEGAQGADVYLEQARSESDSLRRRAILYLGLTAPVGAAQAVAYGLRDPAPEVRRAAVFALAALEGRRSAEALIASLDDPDLGVRRQAVRALEGLFGRQEQGSQAELRWKCWWQTSSPGRRSLDGPPEG